MDSTHVPSGHRLPLANARPLHARRIETPGTNQKRYSAGSRHRRTGRVFLTEERPRERRSAAPFLWQLGRPAAGGPAALIRTAEPSFTDLGGFAGSPWAVTRPGLPQIRTCGFPASGSSSQRFTCAGTPSGRPVLPAAAFAPAVPTGSPSRSGPSSSAGKATSARGAPRPRAYGSARSRSPSPRSRRRGRAVSGSASRAAPGSVGAGFVDTTPRSPSRTGGSGWLPSVS